MQFDFSLLLPEIAIVAVVASLALIEIFRPSFSHRFKSQLSLLGLGIVGASLFTLLRHGGTLFGGMFKVDSFALFFKFLFLASAACVVVMKREDRFSHQGAEFYLLLWSALLGMFFLVSSGDFLIFFISLELMTLSLYVLAAYSQNELFSIEAGLKYLILGSLASAFLLYGMSLIYADSGTLSFEGLRAFVGGEKGVRPTAVPLVFLTGVLFVLSALGFKVAAVPFQVWVPDVYQGAPTPVVAFLSVASKSAGFAALLRIFFEVLVSLEEEKRLLFSLLASLTLLYGNLGALVQKDMKRLLGFSSIGHAGFLLIALAAQSEMAVRSLLYYLVAYALSNLGAFLVLSVVEREQGSHQLEAYQGLSRRSPLLAAGIFIAFLSLAGVPPLAGFFAKFFILLAAAKSGLIWLVFLGVINTAISLYYYLNVIRIVYFGKVKGEGPLSVSIPSTLLLFGLMTGIVVAGVWQLPFFRVVSAACRSLF